VRRTTNSKGSSLLRQLFLSPLPSGGAGHSPTQPPPEHAHDDAAQRIRVAHRRLTPPRATRPTKTRPTASLANARHRARKARRQNDRRQSHTNPDSSPDRHATADATDRPNTSRGCHAHDTRPHYRTHGRKPARSGQISQPPLTDRTNTSRRAHNTAKCDTPARHSDPPADAPAPHTPDRAACTTSSTRRATPPSTRSTEEQPRRPQHANRAAGHDPQPRAPHRPSPANA